MVQKINLKNYFQLRLPKGVSEEIQEDPTGVRALWDRGTLNGASQKVKFILFCLG